MPQVPEGDSSWRDPRFLNQAFPTFWCCLNSLWGHYCYILEGSTTWLAALFSIMWEFYCAEFHHLCDCRFLKLMSPRLLLATLLRRWKNSLYQLWILIQGCRMVGLQSHQQMDMQMTLKLKPTLTSIKCFLVS